MVMIDTTIGLFEIVKIPTLDINEATPGNDEYIDTPSKGDSHLFNKTRICRYPRPYKVVFDKTYEFKRYFTPLLKDFGNKPVLMLVKNPQANAPVE